MKVICTSFDERPRRILAGSRVFTFFHPSDVAGTERIANGWPRELASAGYSPSVEAVVTEDEINDIGFAGVVSPGIVHCDPDPVVQFKVTNLGTSPVNQFTVMSSVNGTALPSQVISNIQLDVGETETFSLNPVTLVPGQNEIELDVSMPNGIPDILTNNTYTLISVLDLTGDRAPLRLTFDNPKETSWRIASPSNGLPWQSFETNKEQSVGYRSYTNPSLGAESWLVSPILDLSSGAFSMFFDISYAQNMPADDWLRVVASRDCGVTYDDILLDRAASTLYLGQFIE